MQLSNFLKKFLACLAVFNLSGFVLTLCNGREGVYVANVEKKNSSDLFLSCLSCIYMIRCTPQIHTVHGLESDGLEILEEL